jgi:hypothetical protein
MPLPLENPLDGISDGAVTGFETSSAPSPANEGLAAHESRNDESERR